MASLETKLYDPVTGERLKLYACKVGDNTVYDPYTNTVLQILQNELGVNYEEAVRLLVNSDIDHPVIANNVEFWVE